MAAGATLLGIALLIALPIAERALAAEATFGIRLVIRAPIRSATAGAAEVATVMPESHYNAAVGLSERPSRVWSTNPTDEINCVTRPALTRAQMKAGSALPGWSNMMTLGRSGYSCFFAVRPLPWDAAMTGGDPGGTMLTLLFE